MTSTVAENRIVAGIWAVGHIDANVRKQKDRDAGTWLTPFFFFLFPFFSAWDLSPWDGATPHSRWSFHSHLSHSGEASTDMPRTVSLRLFQIPSHGQ